MGVAHTGPYQKCGNITYILSQGVGPPHPIQNSSWTSTHYWWPTWPILFQKGLPNYVFNCFHVFLIMSNVKRGIPKKGITNQTMLMYVFHVSFLWFHFQKAFISYMDEVFFVKQCLGNQGSASRISMAGGHLRISKTLRKDAVSLVAGMNSCEKAGFTRDPRNLQSGRTLGSRTPEKTWVYLIAVATYLGLRGPLVRSHSIFYVGEWLFLARLAHRAWNGRYQDFGSQENGEVFQEKQVKQIWFIGACMIYI